MQTLKGMLRGITIDGELNAAEVAEILNWLREYANLLGVAPFRELKEKLDEILADQQIDPEEQEDLLWVCRNLAPDGEYYDDITHDIQQLHGIMHGIMADWRVSMDEARGLQEWVNNHSHLKGSYPYDELESLLDAILADGAINASEQGMLKAFFEDFFEYSFANRVRSEGERIRAGLPKEVSVPGICATCPEVTFEGRVFTFTGTLSRATRDQIVEKITNLGATFSAGVSPKTQYLVIGAGGNQCWAFACYGRKVEKAMGLRKAGVPIVIVHENDFWDAVADCGC